MTTYYILKKHNILYFVTDIKNELMVFLTLIKTISFFFKNLCLENTKQIISIRVENDI
jgi:hypothetical protein